MEGKYYVIMGSAGIILGYLIGPLNELLYTLFIFMAMDYVTGLILAGFFKKSPKSKTGRLSSDICFKGLIRKALILIVVIMGHLIDKILGSNVIRTGVIIAFICNESLSLVENLGLMGVYIPKPLQRAIEILKKKEDEDIE